MAAVGAVNHLFDTSAFFLVLMPFWAFYIGLTALAVILALRKVGPRWIAPAVIIGIAIELASPIPFKARLFFAILVPCFAAVARVVWKLGPEEWAARASA